MPIVDAPVQLTVKHLIAAVKQLPPAELHEFEREFAKWQQRNGAHTDEETELLSYIKANSRLPAADQRRYERLRRKRERRDLTENEFADYQSLLQQLEARNVKRLEALLALAQKRGMTLRGLMKELGLPSLKDAA
jgi:hypothetical protein